MLLEDEERISQVNMTGKSKNHTQRGRKGARRRNGQGYLWKRGNTWQFTVWINGKRKSMSLKTKSKSEAEEKAKEYSQISNAKSKDDFAHYVGINKKFISSKKILLANVWAEYMKSPSRPDSGPNTLDNYKRQWHQFVKWLESNNTSVEHLAEVNIDIALDYAEYLACERNLAPATYNAHRNVLCLITKTLARKSGISDNPWEQITKKTLDTVEKKDLKEEEVSSIFKKLEDSDYNLPNRSEWQIVFHAGVFAGLRLIDAIQLTWESIDWNKNEISLIPEKTKRKLKRVRLPIHPSFNTKLFLAKSWKSNENNFVCPHLAKRYSYNPSGVKKDAVKVFKDCGFETSIKVVGRSKAANVIGFHSLRYSFVSLCANAGVSLTIVQALVGHGSPAMTRHYTRIYKESAEKAINTLPDLNGIKDNYFDLTDSEKISEIENLLTKSNNLSDRETAILNILKC